jgi:subtilase family serine protease
VNSDSQGGETPQSLRTLYGIPANGGSELIAVVVAFHYATIEADLAQFNTKFALPACTIPNGCLRVISLTSTVQCSWAAEAALDVQWIHALAPRAKILLVEAKTDNLDDMFDAVSKAAQEVKSAGGGLVSMSWASEEFSGEETYDKTFIDGVLFVASSGDVGGLVTYPAASPRVVSVGGTSLVRDNAGQLVSEIGWNGSGGGYSAYETLPPYQQGIANISTGARSIPDVSANADPYSGVSVWIGVPCSGSPGWRQAGGTSLAAPIIAAMINVAGIRRNTSAAEVQAVYANAMNSARVRDITSGTAGSNTATPGYDRVTGLGVPQSIDFDKQ